MSEARSVPRVVVLEGARTPMAEWISGRRGDGAPGGALSAVSAIDLGATSLRGALARAAVPAAEVDHVVMGNALQTSGDALYGARHVALRAGCDIRTPGLTVNRLCGSGIQSIVSGAHILMNGEARLVAAGGMENLSQAPHALRGLRKGLRLGEGALEDTLMVALMDTQCGLMMAQTAERLAARYEVTRAEQDAFALLSQERAARARAAGIFAEEIVPVSAPAGKGKTVEVSADDHLKPDTTLDGLSALPPAFSRDGMVTAGNASGIVDGAACVLLMREGDAHGAGRAILGRILGWSVVGVEPAEMGIGPAPAIRALLERFGISVASVDRYEINEAFAGQYLAVERDLELDRDRVNVHGGAIALGHPLGASGTRLVLTLLRELRRTRLRLGVAAACIGGGQGIAMLVENPDAA